MIGTTHSSECPAAPDPTPVRQEVLMVVGFAGRSDIPPNNLDRSIPSAV